MTNEDALPLRQLLDAAPDGFIVVATDGSIVWANQTASELFGYLDRGLAGLAVEELIPLRLRERHVHERSAYLEAPRGRSMGLGLNLLGLRKDGTEFPVEISLSPVRTQRDLLITAVVRDVSERHRLEEERNALALELETERERDRIAMDLHDGIMQDIYAVALGLELAVEEVDDNLFADASTVERSIGQLHEVVRNIRSYIFDLRPRQFAGRLQQALHALAQEFQQNSQVATAIELDEDLDVEAATGLALYHIAHECLSNIQRHARAQNVIVKFARSGETGQLAISDDGTGFNTDAVIGEEHRGLRNIGARARSVSAQFEVESSPGKGTRYTVTFPLRP